MTLLSLPNFALTLVFAGFVLADVEFTSPAAGADVAVGKIDVTWKDSGRAPAIADLTQYTLDLMVGGNEVDNMVPITNFQAGGSFDDAWTVQGTIESGIAAPISNGFFLRIISTSLNGGTVYDYSDRFSITGLTGETGTTYRDAVAALNGDTSGPPRSGNGLPATPSSSSTSVTPTGSTIRETFTVTRSGHAAASSSFGVLDYHDHNAGPDRGAIAGAVVGSLAFLFAAIGIGIWVFRRQKRRRNGIRELSDKDDMGKQPSVSVTTLSELSAEGKVIEIGDGIPPPEMDSTNVRAELEGDCSHIPKVMVGPPPEYDSPLTPIAPSISEETLGTATWPASVV